MFDEHETNIKLCFHISHVNSKKSFDEAVKEEI